MLAWGKLWRSGIKNGLEWRAKKIRSARRPDIAIACAALARSRSAADKEYRRRSGFRW